MNESRLKPWLIASLVLNLFLAGGIAGGAWKWWTTERAAPVAGQATQARGLRFAADDLPAEQRRAYRMAMRDARREVAASIQTAREGRQEVLRLVGAPQFDRAAAAAALARTREADTIVRARFETTVIDYAATLSPSDRQALAAGLARRSSLGPPAAPASRSQ